MSFIQTHKKLSLIFLAAIPAGAATMSSSPTAPLVGEDDIANYGIVTNTDKWFVGKAYGDPGSAKGQTFNTGDRDVLFKAVTYQVAAGQKAEPTKTYVIRIGSVTDSTFTELHSEEATQNFLWGIGEYMTWTFDSPVHLAANTTYAVDVSMTSSTSGWQTGIPYLNVTADSYDGGFRYTSGLSGAEASKLQLEKNRDRLFHLQMESPNTANCVTPVAVMASSWWKDETRPGRLIDGSGLSTNAPTAGHDSASDAASMWLAGVGKGTGGEAPVVAEQAIIFDLGKTRDLSQVHIWNQNQTSKNLHLERGVKTFRILVSSDKKSFKPVGRTLALQAAAGTSAEKAQVFPIEATEVRYVRFDILSAHSGKKNEYVGLSEVRFLTTGDAYVRPVAPPKPPTIVATNEPAVPGKVEPVNPVPTPAEKPAFPVTFSKPSETVKPSLTVLSPDSLQEVDEAKLEFRFWRNMKRTKSIEAAVLDVDEKSGHMHLYLRGGKNYILAIADYHDDDKTHLMEWLEMRGFYAERDQAKTVKPVAETSIPIATPAIAEALTLRLLTDTDKGKVEAGDSQNTYTSDHEVIVQVVTDPRATANIPEGELQLVAYVVHTLKDAVMKGTLAIAAEKSDSISVKEMKIPSQAIKAFEAGTTENKTFLFSTETVKGKSPLGFRWEHDQTLLGVRARLMIGGKLAVESVYPSDLDRQLKEHKNDSP